MVIREQFRVLNNEEKDVQPVKKIVQVKETGCTYESLLGQKVLFMCAAYFYYGTLTGVNKTHIELTDASIVFDVGKWDSSKWENAEKLPSKQVYVKLSAVESFMQIDRG